MYLEELPFIPPVFHQGGVTLIQADVIDGLNSLEPNSIDAMCTSNPYQYMVGYSEEGQHGLEPTLQAYLEVQVNVAKAAHRPLKEYGILAVNNGDVVNNYSTTRDKHHKRVTGDWVGRRPIEPEYWLESEDKAAPWRYAIEVNALAGFRYLGYRLWDKMGQGNRVTKLGKADGEPILFFVKQTKGRRLNPKYLKPFESMFLRHRPVSDDVHRCPYPESLAREILEHIADPYHEVDNNERVICDFYCGTGTTNRAAYELGMKSIGIDLNCDRAIELTRIRLLKGKQPVQLTLAPPVEPEPVESESKDIIEKDIVKKEDIIKLVTVGKRTQKKARGYARANPATPEMRDFHPTGWIETRDRNSKTKGIKTIYYYRWNAGGKAQSIRLDDYDHAQAVRKLIEQRKRVVDIRAFLGDYS